MALLCCDRHQRKQQNGIPGDRKRLSHQHDYRVFLFPARNVCAEYRAMRMPISLSMRRASRSSPGSGMFIEQIRNIRAFSLLEMMVAVTLLLIIISALLAMFYQTQRALRLSKSQV